ncbi:hypothetical protein SAMD00019534_126610, partial [Acytostelium subglobosum LB1]|uniref:hypothetical protein n=1 Tax=Acytostelium subglobosum LB1 TaxID=1410327 RepID=UPI000644CB89
MAAGTIKLSPIIKGGESSSGAASSPFPKIKQLDGIYCSVFKDNIEIVSTRFTIRFISNHRLDGAFKSRHTSLTRTPSSDEIMARALMKIYTTHINGNGRQSSKSMTSVFSSVTSYVTKSATSWLLGGEQDTCLMDVNTAITPAAFIGSLQSQYSLYQLSSAKCIIYYNRSNQLYTQISQTIRHLYDVNASNQIQDEHKEEEPSKQIKVVDTSTSSFDDRLSMMEKMMTRIEAATRPPRSSQRRVTSSRIQSSAPSSSGDIDDTKV